MGRSSEQRMRRGAELAAGLAALAIAAAVMTWLSGTDRAQLLFRDGDSVLPLLVLHSLAAGQPQDWALSPVLFAPELALVALVTLLGAGPVAALWTAGAAQFALLYGALRLVAGRARHAPWAALAGTAIYALLAAGGTSEVRRSLELAGLLGTTTYYSGTLLAALVVIAASARFLGRGHPGQLAVAALVTALGVLCNPLLGAWALAPIGAAALLRLLLARRRAEPAAPSAVPSADRTIAAALESGIRLERTDLRQGRRAAAAEADAPPAADTATTAGPAHSALRGWRATALLLGTLGAAAALGLALRVPLRGLFVLDGSSYARPERWLDSLRGFAELLQPTPASFGAAALLLAAGAACWLAARTGLRRRDPQLALLGLVGLLGPAVVLLGAIALGTDAPRYLQPIAFLPLLGVAALASSLGREGRDAGSPGRDAAPARGAVPPAPTRASTSDRGDARVHSAEPATRAAARLIRSTAVARVIAPIVAVTASAALLLVALATPPVLERAADDPDADCVTAWIERSDAVGAGQFWTVRYPKSRLDDPSRLVQTTHELRPYAWLVNRADFDVAAVEFLLTDAQSPAFSLPADVSTTAIGCGRYTILQLSRSLPLA